MDTATAVYISPVTQATDLFRWYDGQSEPQPCLLKLDLTDGELTCDYNPEISNAVPEPVDHRRTLTFEIPCLTADAANQLMAEVQPLAQRILAGASIEWNGSSHVGVLNDDAQAAEDELAAAVAENFDLDRVCAIFPSEWYGDFETAASATGLTADTSDRDLAALTTQAEEDIKSIAAGVVVVLRLDEYLRRVREDLRTTVRDDLEDVVARINGLIERRNTLVRQIAAWDADSDRDIGALAGKSHTWVQKIVAAGAGKAQAVGGEYGALTDYTTGEPIRPATADEHARSLSSGETGAFELDGRAVFVAGGPEEAHSDGK